FPAWRAWLVVVTTASVLRNPDGAPDPRLLASASPEVWPSTVVVLIKLYFPVLLHGIRLLHVQRQAHGRRGQGSLMIVWLVDHPTLLLREIGRWLLQIALAHP